MNEKDLYEIDIAKCHLNDACLELTKAYVKQIKRLEEENAELVQKVHILNEANMNLENAIASHAEFYQQKISVLQSLLEECLPSLRFCDNLTFVECEKRLDLIERIKKVLK